MAITLSQLLTDARSEWSLRWTVLIAVCYAVFFYPPSTIASSAWIDWSLPIQLASGGNLGFYNAGFHVYFGVGAAVAMVVGGSFLAVIFPLLQRNELGAAYATLLSLLTILALPVIRKIGVLNNGTSLTLLLILIFTEVFYGPILNLRAVLPNPTSIYS